MSAVITAPFGDQSAILAAAAANAAYARALKLGYNRRESRCFAAQARHQASQWEEAADTAMRVVYPPRGTFAGPTGGAA